MAARSQFSSMAAKISVKYVIAIVFLMRTQFNGPNRFEAYLLSSTKFWLLLLCIKDIIVQQSLLTIKLVNLNISPYTEVNNS